MDKLCTEVSAEMTLGVISTQICLVQRYYWFWEPPFGLRLKIRKDYLIQQVMFNLSSLGKQMCELRLFIISKGCLDTYLSFNTLKKLINFISLYERELAMEIVVLMRAHVGWSI